MPLLTSISLDTAPYTLPLNYARSIVTDGSHTRYGLPVRIIGTNDKDYLFVARLSTGYLLDCVSPDGLEVYGAFLKGNEFRRCESFGRSITHFSERIRQLQGFERSGFSDVATFNRKTCKLFQVSLGYLDQRLEGELFKAIGISGGRSRSKQITAASEIPTTGTE